MTPVSLPTLTHPANTRKTNSTPFSSLWTDVTAVATTTQNSRSASQSSTKLKAFSSGKKLAETIAATTSTTGTSAEKSDLQTWASAAA